MELKLDISDLNDVYERINKRLEVIETMLGQGSEARKYLNRNEASDYLRISVATLDRLASAGDIAPAKLGDSARSTVVYDRSDLDEYVKSRKGLTAYEADNIIQFRR